MKLEVKDGTFAYPRRERIVLKNIGFSLESGDVLAILGPNGAGKTTLLRCMTGLLRWKSGTTLIDGVPLSGLPRRTLWKRISYVPQAKQVTSAYTVEQMVLLGRASSVDRFSLPGKEDTEAVDRCLSETNIGHLRGRSCAELSGGELQMVLIARALASEPELLILDEPESNLDYRNQLLVLDMISSLSSRGITCVYNTHYPAHALRRGNKALMLSKDGSYCFGNVQEVVTEENLLRYFGVRTVIAEFEAEGESYPDVIPIAIDRRGGGAPADEKKTEKDEKEEKEESDASP